LALGGGTQIAAALKVGLDLSPAPPIICLHKSNLTYG
jgi:hypothetical protein